MQGLTGIPGLTSAANADPTANQGGSVASTLAGTAVPPGPAPGTFGATNITAGFSPYNKVLAGSYAADPNMANVATGINLGKDITTGPGTDFPTRNAIITSQSAPQHVQPGENLVVDPLKGLTPGNVITGGSPYDTKVSETMAGTNPASAEHDISQAADATVNLGKAQGIMGLFNNIVAPESTPGGIFTEAAAKNASDFLGIPLDRILQMGVPGVKAEIRSRFASMVSNLRDNMGQPMFKGGLPEIMSQFPDPDLEPERFRSMVGTLTTTLQQQAADGQAAMAYMRHPSQGAYVDLLAQKAANAANARAAFASAGLQDTGGGGGGEGSGNGPTWPTPPRSKIQLLREHPEKRADFDALYGPGAAARVLGQ